MKLILLRHEERYIDVGFFSNLTDNGVVNACTTLVTKLKKIHIDTIYCSPFIRTMQTIFPYCDKYNKKINIEYGLYEYLHNPYFLLSPWYYEISDVNDNDLKSIINKNYKSIVNKNDFNLLENEFDLEIRIRKFFDKMLYNKDNSNKTILIVSHKGVLNKIKDFYLKKTNMDDEFEMGSFEIYNI